MKDIIKKILEGKYQVDKTLSQDDQELDKEIFNKIKTIYDTCMDEDTINKKGKEPLINLLNQFDLYNNKSKYEGVDGLTNLIADLHHYGVDIIFKFVVVGDIIKHDLNIMGMVQPDLLLLKDQYKNEKDISKYKSTIIETLELLFKDQKNERNIEEMTNKIIEFEKKLSDFTIPAYVIIYKQIIKIIYL